MRTEDNELLCRVGADTGMGKVARRFWVPACLSADLPEPGGAPIRIRLLGEHLVAFRGSDGKVGLLDEYCPHRGSSLLLARNEDCALRCIFHGWKMARDGAILDMPNDDNPAARRRYRARAFAVEESHGLVWAWLGDQANVPERPRYAWEALPPEHSLVLPVDLDCNWVQSLEGLVDTSHTGVLHEDVLQRLPRELNRDIDSLRAAKVPRLDIERTDFGFHYGALRDDGSGRTQVRVTAYIAPFLCLIPPTGQAFMTVPLDDHRTRFYNIWWSKDELLDRDPGRQSRIDLWGLTDEILDATGMRAVNPTAGEVVPVNRFAQDRVAMQGGRSFSGLPGLTAEDGAVAVLMGAIATRANENLVAADAAVVALRKALLGAARAAERGEPLAFAGGRTPSIEIDAVSAALEPGQNWRTLVPRHVASKD